MAHELTITNGLAEMAYAGEAPWTGLGQKFEGPGRMTAKEALTLAGLGWKAVKKPVRVVDGKRLQNCYAIIREDTGEVLSDGVVRSHYKVFQNEDKFEFFDQVIQDPNGPHFETAGSLFGGKHVWMLAKLPDFIEVSKDDVIDQYLLLRGGHDGLTPVQMFWTPTRVVCNNTLTFAHKNAQSKVKFKHVGRLTDRTTFAQDMLGVLRENISLLGDVLQAMTKYEPTDDEVEEVLDTLFPKYLGEEKKTDRVFKPRIKNKVKELAVAGRGNEKYAGTAYGLYNGITEYVDHYKAFNPRFTDKAETRMAATLFGSGAKIKSDAFELITALLN